MRTNARNGALDLVRIKSNIGQPARKMALRKGNAGEILRCLFGRQWHEVRIDEDELGEFICPLSRLVPRNHREQGSG